jgi:Cu+-exporting ATPase
MITREYNVTGMTCQGCASSVTRVISRNKGVDDCVVRHMEGEVVVTYDENLIDDEKIMSQITRLGFKAEVKV